MKYPIGTPTVGNIHVTTPQPLDNKYLFADNTDLADIVNNNPLSYYEGMIVQNCDTGIKYRWVESTVGVIPGGYTYGAYSYEGVVYTGRTFNFVPVGNPITVFDVGDTFPPLENYPQGTIALRPYVENGTIVVTHEATDTGDITITFNGVDIVVAVVLADSIPTVIGKIQTTLDGDAAFDDYVVTEDGIDTVTIVKLTNASDDADIVFDDTDTTGVTANTTDLTTFTGVYKKQNNVAPGTWTELMTFTSIFSVGFVESVVSKMFGDGDVFAGSGGSYGTAKSAARSDHDHSATYAPVHTHPYLPDTTTGLLYMGSLNAGHDMDTLLTFGIYNVPIGTQRPTNFPLTADIGYAFSAWTGFIVTVKEEGSTNDHIIQIVEDLAGPICYRKYNHSGGGTWYAWTRYEATDAEMLDPTETTKKVTPSSLKAHENWIDGTASLLHSWAGTLQYRKRTDGNVELYIQANGDAVAESHCFTLPATYRPIDSFTNIILRNEAGRLFPGYITINPNGEILLYSHDAVGADDWDGNFNAKFSFSLDTLS